MTRNKHKELFSHHRVIKQSRYLNVTEVKINLRANYGSYFLDKIILVPKLNSQIKDGICCCNLITQTAGLVTLYNILNLNKRRRELLIKRSLDLDWCQSQWSNIPYMLQRACNSIEFWRKCRVTTLNSVNHDWYSDSLMRRHCL